MIKFLIGGSPCTYWSIAQTKNRETKDEGLGWELFVNYCIDSDKYKREKREANSVFYIKNGFFPICAEKHRKDPDRGLKDYSTETRWSQYQKGIISRTKAIELATKRALKNIDKETAGKFAKLDRIAAAPDITEISISVDWVKSRIWGYNPHAEIQTASGIYTGTASGCGYDKESTAIAEALNESNEILKFLYTLKEEGLRAGLTDESTTDSSGVDNRAICGYGAGYSVLPYFEGGVGVSCFWKILEKCGFSTKCHYSEKSNFYYIEKNE